MEEQIQQFSDIKVNLTPLMMAMAIPISFAIQFIKALANKVEFFKAEEIRKSFFPMVSIAITMAVYYIAGLNDWLLAGVVMGLAASGGYQAFNGAAKLVNGNGNKHPMVPAAALLLCAMLLFAGCSQVQMSPEYRQNLEMTNVVVQSLNDDCQAGDPNACSKGLAESAEILQLLVDAVHGTASKGGQQ